MLALKDPPETEKGPAALLSVKGQRQLQRPRGCVILDEIGSAEAGVEALADNGWQFLNRRLRWVVAVPSNDNLVRGPLASFEPPSIGVLSFVAACRQLRSGWRSGAPRVEALCLQRLPVRALRVVSQVDGYSR
jgi:hypothetical protein